MYEQSEINDAIIRYMYRQCSLSINVSLLFFLSLSQRSKYSSLIVHNGEAIRMTMSESPTSALWIGGIGKRPATLPYVNAKDLSKLEAALTHQQDLAKSSNTIEGNH